MSVGTVVSVEEYLNTSFEDGDREYLDGRIVERNWGEIEHGDLQSATATYLRNYYPALWAAVEVRVQVKPTRFRVPDICVVLGGKPEGRIVVAPPFLVIEVLSREDRVVDLEEKMDDYLAFGVKYVWVINPRTRRGYIHTSRAARKPNRACCEPRTPRSRSHSPRCSNPCDKSPAGPAGRDRRYQVRRSAI